MVSCSPARVIRALNIALVISGLATSGLQSQDSVGTRAARDTTLAANRRFEAGRFHRFLLGDNWRDEWTTPITVPFLDLRSFEGGLRAVELAGGRQTRTLRLEAKDSTPYVFRPVNKGVDLPGLYRHTIIWYLLADGRSSLHPTAPVLGVPILAAAGVLHPSPILFVMPDDSRLGEFRQRFAGALGTIEERPKVRENGHSFAGAKKIIDTKELLERINRDPENRIDTRAYLAARLVDMLLNDNDRHPGQFDWARLAADSNALWIPIARDRDKLIHSEEGLFARLAGFMNPSIIKFASIYPSLPSLTTQATEMDRRLLIGLDRPAWDSVAAAVVRKIPDAVIEAAVHRLPREYSASFPGIIGKLKARRDKLPKLARDYYAFIAQGADIHGTDADEVATVVRSADGIVEVSIRSGNRAPHFSRRFNARETSEIRLYLHGGDDLAIVRGDVRHSIHVRIIGGAGTNTLIDSSRVGGDRNPTHLYDAGTVGKVRYDADSADKREFTEEEVPFNRRPWTRAYLTLAPAQKDRGGSMHPVVTLRSGHGLGFVPGIGVAHYQYGFRKVPYASMQMADVAYSTAVRGFDVGLGFDKRLESSSFHTPISARMSQLEVVEFRGFGNDVPDLRGPFYEVRQRQWTFRPALAFSPNIKSDISLGPVVRRTSTDSIANRFITQQRPYGFSTFNQAGLQLQVQYDSRGSPELFDIPGRNVLIHLAEGDRSPYLWGKIRFAASFYPAMLDVRTTYEKLSGVASTYVTAPVFTHPTLALRVGGEKLYGDFPYFDAAFIGGSRSLRTEHGQRFAGDASLYGTTELRVPLVHFPLILPLNVGAIGFVDIARVYVDGESAGGPHKGTGAGLWISFVRPELGVTIMRTNNPERPTLVSLGFAF
ncbi:MAG TPA: hypothetical protein VEK37_10530 [Gemmatimonadaceae bacterium]|nr:hypothetical protein [Gemmatimonadaceae bacterium]